MTVWNECKGWNRLGDDQVGFLADGNRAEDVAYTHCICSVDGAGVE